MRSPAGLADGSSRSSADGKKARDIRTAHDQLPHLFERKRRFDVVDLEGELALQGS
jgi:hypothetical protein